MDRDEEYQAAKKILDEGGAVSVDRFQAGRLRGYFRSRKGETRRVYLINPRGFRNSPKMVTVELREKGDFTR